MLVLRPGPQGALGLPERLGFAHPLRAPVLIEARHELGGGRIIDLPQGSQEVSLYRLFQGNNPRVSFCPLYSVKRKIGFILTVHLELPVNTGFIS